MSATHEANRRPPSPVAHALFDSLGLAVHYNLRSDELPTSIAQVTTPSSVDALRSAVHETMHMVQLCGTAYGFFYSCLKRVQTSYIHKIITAIRGQHGLPVRLPIIEQLRGLRDAKYSHLHAWLERWYACELTLLVLEADSDTFFTERHRHPVLRSWTTEDLLDEAVSLVGDLFGRLGVSTGVEGRGHLKPFGPAELAQLAYRLVSGGSSLDVLEGAATAAEWHVYLSPTTSPSSALGAANAPWHYLTLLEQVNQLYQPTDLGSAARIHFALSEIALSGPILPIHRFLWDGNTSANDLLPYLRYTKALRYCGSKKVPPPADYAGDWERFTRDVCDGLGWLTPRELASHTPVALRESRWIKAGLFEEAQRIRAKLPTVFADPTILLAWYIDQRRDSISMGYLASLFRPFVEEFTDGVRMRDRHVGVTLMVDFASETYLRQALLSNDLRVRMPWALDEETIVACRKGIEEMMLQAGGERPRVEFAFREPESVSMPADDGGLLSGESLR